MKFVQLRGGACLFLQGMCVILFCLLRLATCAQVNSAAEEPLSDGPAMAVKALGRLTLQNFAAAELPDSSRAAYQAVGVLMQYIMSLQPDTCIPSAGTLDPGTHAGMPDWKLKNLDQRAAAADYGIRA